MKNMDWQTVIIKAIIGGLVAVGAKLVSAPVIADWATLWTVVAGAFILGALNVISQWISPIPPEPVAAGAAIKKKVGFWSRVKRAL